MNELGFVNILEVDDELRSQVRLWRNREDVRTYMLDSHIITEEEHCAWLDGLRESKRQKFWIVFYSEVPIGAVYLHDIDEKTLSSSWGFYIGEANYRQKGLGKKILLGLLEKFFEKMRLKTLHTTVYAKNSAAINIYRKFHFKEIEPGKDGKGNKLVNLVFTESDWKEYKESLFDGDTNS